VDAQVALGRLLTIGIHGSPDYESAYTWFVQAAEAGEAYAQAWMGDCCRYGLVGISDAVAAEQWYRRAAKQEHRGAQIMLATLLSSVEEHSEPMLEEALEIWRAAAAAGNAFAQRNLAECLLTGRGCEVDPESAVLWFQAAAEQGDTEAEYRLRQCYQQGIGTSEFPNSARHWFERAAEKGHNEAEGT
jgi:TPR repeat protein